MIKQSILLILALLFISGCGGTSLFWNDEETPAGGPAFNTKDASLQLFLSESGRLVPAAGLKSILNLEKISETAYCVDATSEVYENSEKFFSKRWNGIYSGQKALAIIVSLDQKSNIVKADFVEVTNPAYDSANDKLAFDADWEGSTDDSLMPPADSTFETGWDTLENSLFPPAGLAYGKTLFILCRIPDIAADKSAAPLKSPSGIDDPAINTQTLNQLSTDQIYDKKFSPSAMLMLVQLAMVGQIDFEIQMQAEEVNNINKQIKDNNDQLAKLRDILKQNLDSTGAAKDKKLHEELQRQIDNIKTYNDTLQNSNQMDMIRLQNYMNARNTAFDMTTNLLSKDQNTRDSIVGNLRSPKR